VATVDEYLWLEDVGSEEVRQWIEAENRRFREFIGGIAERLYPRLRALYEMPVVYSVALYRGGLYLVSRERGTYVVKRLDFSRGEYEEVLRSEELGENVTISAVSPTPDGGVLGVNYHVSGADESTLLVLDVEAGDRIEVLRGYISPPVWLSRGEFLYTRFYRSGRTPDGVPAPASRVHLHEMGGEDRVVFGEGFETNWMMGLKPLYDRGVVFVTAMHGWSESKIYVARLPGLGEFALLFDGRGSRALPVGYEDGRAYVLYYGENHLGSILEVSEDGSRVVISAEEYPIEGAAVHAGRIVASRLVDGANELYAYSLDGGLEGRLLGDLPPGSLSILGSGWGTLVVRYSSFDTPSRLFVLDEGMKVRFVEGESLDLGLEVEDVWVTSRDGTRVHGFLVKSGRAGRCSGVAVVYGYGGFAIPVKPAFYVNYIPMLEEGAVLVITNLRGGSEYGEEWHRAGWRRNKHRVFEDFEAFLEEMRRRGYRTVATGSSNGGLLVAAVVTRRPELVDVALIGYPLTDMLRFHLLHIGKLWTTEYGDPEDPGDRAYLASYSPYHNVRRGVRYPHVLVYTGLHDDRVHPAHALKFVAKLRDAGAPAYLRVETVSGHMGATPEVRAREAAEVLAFAYKALRLDS